MHAGGLALASGIIESGLDDWLGEVLKPLSAVPLIVVAIALVGLVILVTEFASNVATASDDTCLLGFTSGTTGVPKATMHFHRDVMAICHCWPPHMLKPTADDVFIGSPPLAFTFGLGGLVLFPMSVGASTVLLEKASPPQLLDGIDLHIDIALEIDPGRMAEIGVGRPGEAIGAAMLATLIGVHAIIHAHIRAGEFVDNRFWVNIDELGFQFRFFRRINVVKVIAFFLREEAIVRIDLGTTAVFISGIVRQKFNEKAILTKL